MRNSVYFCCKIGRILYHGLISLHCLLEDVLNPWVPSESPAKTLVGNAYQRNAYSMLVNLPEDPAVCHPASTFNPCHAE